MQLGFTRRLAAFEIGAFMIALLTHFSSQTASTQEMVSAPVQPKDAYFYFDAESQKDGAPLPQPPFFPSPWREPDAAHPKRGRVVADPTAPQGKHVFCWEISEPNIKEVYQEIKFARLPEAKPKDFFYAFFVRFDRKDGKDIWHDASNGREADSFDKAFEVIGNGIRWVIHFGNHDIRMRDHHFFVLCDKCNVSP